MYVLVLCVCLELDLFRQWGICFPPFFALIVLESLQLLLLRYSLDDVGVREFERFCFSLLSFERLQKQGGDVPFGVVWFVRVVTVCEEKSLASNFLCLFFFQGILK